MTRLIIESDRRVDALVAGTVFLDVVLADLPRGPEPGEEVWAGARALSPGGIANNAVALSRLGMATALVASIGVDAPATLLWEWLAQEPNLDLSGVLRTPEVETAVTVSLSMGDERALVSHGTLDPLPVERILDSLPLARTCFVSLKPEPVQWASLEHAAGAAVFAGVGFDDRHGWSHSVLEQLQTVDVLVLNELEALAYARADDVETAARALGARVPLVVVTRGSRGAFAWDSASSQGLSEPAVPVQPVDPTGAGDVFVSALMHAWRSEDYLAHRLRYANLCAALSVLGMAGAASAPTAQDVSAWLDAHPDARKSYGFLDDWAVDSPLPATACGPRNPSAPRGTRRTQ